MSEFGGLWKHQKTQDTLYYLISVGQRDSVAVGFPWGKRPELSTGEIHIGTTKCTKYKYKKTIQYCDHSVKKLIMIGMYSLLRL